MSRTKSCAAASISHHFFSPKVSNRKSNSVAALVLAEIQIFVGITNVPIPRSNRSLMCCICLDSCGNRRLPIVSQCGQKCPCSVAARLRSDDRGLAPDVFFAPRVAVLANGLPLFSAESEFSDQLID